MLLLSKECILLIIGIIILRFRNKISYIGEIVLVGLISVPALYFIPGKSDDLYKYFLEMNVVKSCGSVHSLFMVYKTVPWLSQHKTNFIYDIFQWLISRNGNYALLAFCSAFIVYLCIFTPFIHQFINDKYKKYSNIKLFLGLFLVSSLFPYNNVISTIRWNIAVATFFMIVYISFNYRHPILTIPLYLIPLGVHEGLLLPILLIIMCILLKNIHITNYMYLLFGIIVFILLFIASYKFSIFNYYNSISFSMFLGTRFMTFSFWFVWIMSYIYAILGIILVRLNKSIDFNLEIKSLYFAVISDVLLIPFNFTMANRYALIVGLCGILLYLKVIQHNGHIPNNIKCVYISLIIICFLIIGYSVFHESYNFSQINYGGLFNILQ